MKANKQKLQINQTSKQSNYKILTAYLCEPEGIFEIESLSMSLYSTFEFSKVPLFVQLTGTKIAKERIAIGTKSLSLVRKRTNIHH